jgi:hypothetical protein
MTSSYGSWIYIYICNQCLSPLKLCIKFLPVSRDKVCQCELIKTTVPRFDFLSIANCIHASYGKCKDGQLYTDQITSARLMEPFKLLFINPQFTFLHPITDPSLLGVKSCFAKASLWVLSVALNMTFVPFSFTINDALQK